MIELIAKLILKNKQKKANSKRAEASVPDEDFIPYVCHYDPNTILTKNGELLQTIRITGFSTTAAISEIISLRDSVRESIADSVSEQGVALWFHTIRRKKNIVPKGDFTDFFSQKLNEFWVNDHGWDDQYVNELYITFIVEGFDTSVANFSAFLRSLSFSATKSLHKSFLANAHFKLSKIVQKAKSDLEEYGAKLLGINEWEGVLYSEPMRFFGKIINLYEERYPLAANDISNEMSTHKIAFGDREIEVSGHNNKNFAAILSLKEYFDISSEALDHILQLPFEFVISQSFDFSPSPKEKEHFEYQNYILQVSGDEALRQEIGLANLIDNQQGLPTDFGKMQTTIEVIANNLADLEKDVKMVVEQFGLLGLVLVREDVFLEHCFWSQLPGNFTNLRRQKLTSSRNVGGFAALHNYPSGQISGNKWGSAITVLKSILNTPYFFNFHKYGSGNTLIIGPKDSGKTIILNFLLTQSLKLKPKIFYFDSGKKSQSLCRVLGGKYYSIGNFDENLSQPLHLDPFSFPSEQAHHLFSDLIFSAAELSLDKSRKQSLELEIAGAEAIIEKIFASEIKDFATAIEQFKTPETANIYEELKVFGRDGLKDIFFSGSNIDFSTSFLAFDLDSAKVKKTSLILIFNYLLSCIDSVLNESPTIIVLKDALSFLNNDFFAARIELIMQRLKERNAILVFVENDLEAFAKSQISPLIKAAISTEIIMPNQQPQEFYKTILGLDDEGVRIVSIMHPESGNFMIRNQEDSVIFSFKINGIEFEKILSADEETLHVTSDVFEFVKNEFAEEGREMKDEDWILRLFEVLKEIEKQRIEEIKEELRRERAEKRKKFKQSTGEI